MNYFKQILHFAKPYKKFAYLNVFFNILYALFSSLSFLALIPMMGVLFNKEEAIHESVAFDWNPREFLFDNMNYLMTQVTEEHGRLTTLSVSCALIISLFLLKNISNYFAMFFMTFLRNGVLKDLRNTMYKKMLALQISYFSEQKKGDTISKITNDIQELQWTFLSMLELIVREPLTIIITIVMMVMISPQLTLFVFVFLPVMGLFITYIGKKLKKHSDRVQQEQGHFVSLVEETLSGLKIIKGFNAEEKFQNTFEKSTSKLNTFLNGLLNRQNLASPTSEFLGIVSIAGILWFGGQMVIVDNSLKAEEFIGFITLAYNILTPAKQMSKAVSGIKRGDAAAERVLELLNTEETITDIENPIEKSTFKGEISLNNISFKYEEEYILKDFSLTIPKGKTVALVGQSGSGKSTIANLVNRFYDVNEGNITIDGADIKSLSKKSLRKLMGLVTQDSILFNESIKNSILLGDANATDDDIINAAKIANAHDFISEFQNGYETNIGDSGNKLSGGQKQRLSIARAVLKNPPIMVLDEATSALDTESERLVQDALENMMKNRTSIVIAHRLSTIQKADIIVVLQKGKIIEQGSHQELLDKNGSYKKLVEMQSFA